ncbi:hypothetical protein BDY19DRAFT_981727, partial [Irpex rosettiformis]
MKLSAKARCSESSRQPRAESPVCKYCKSSAHSGEKLMRCSRCKQTAYCSGTCQSSDWPTHKKTCAKA